MAIVESANYAGFCSGDHICICLFGHVATYVDIPTCNYHVKE